MGSVGRLVRIGVFSGAALTGAAAASLLPPHATLTDAHFAAATAATAAVRALTDGETAHRLAVWAAARGLTPVDGRPDPPCLRTTVCGRTFRNPIGLAAGFDKDADAVEGMLGLGFGFVEIGSVTPLPQPGNPRPRVFRLPSARAIINRYGFNSEGADAVLRRVSAWRADHPRPPPPPPPAAASPPTSPPPPGLLGVNLGKNKAQADAAADYAAGARAFAPLADFLVVNVSSPNTPGLRALQSRASLTALLKAAVAARDAACAEAAGGEEKGARAWWWGGRAAAAPPPSARVPPLLVKVDADADDAAAADVAAAALAAGVDGVIVSNTTVTRPPSVASLPSAREAGGLSGPPLRPLATAAVARMHRLLKGRLPIVGVGGVGDGEAAYEKIKAGASLVELYTALAYDGPALVPRVKAELAALLAADGYESVADAVGVEAHKY